MIATLRAIAQRCRAAASRRVLVTTLAATLAAAAAGLGAGYALAHGTASASAPAAAPPAASTPSPLPGAAGHHPKANSLGRQLVALVARQTGQTPKHVVAALTAGQTLNQIAGTHTQAVIDAATAAAKTKLDSKVSAGKLTPAKEATRLTMLQAQINSAMAEPGPQLVASLKAQAGGAAATPSPSPAAGG